MRMHQIKGRLVNDIRNDSTSTMNRWILNHEFRVTYRDSLLSSEELLEGNWIATIEQGAPISVSISDNIWATLGLSFCYTENLLFAA